MLVEAVLLGLIGSTGGLLLGFAIAFSIQVMFAAVGMDLSGAGMRLTPQALLWTYAVGLLVTIVAAAFPAIRAGRVPPVAAMSGDVMTGKSGLGWRAVGGGLMIAFGMVALLTGLVMDTLDNRLWYVTTGASNFLLGVAAVSPILGRPVVWLLGRLNQAVFGQVGRLAEVNALRNPRRTAWSRPPP